MKLLFASLLLATALPAVAQVEPIETESFLIRQAPIEQVYLLLMLDAKVNSRTAQSVFPMPDINQCKKEGKRWKTTAIDGIDGRLKSYYCVKGSK